MNKKLTVGIGIGIVVGVMSMGALYGVNQYVEINGGGFLPSATATQDAKYSQLKIDALQKVIGKNYIEDISQESTIEGIYKGFVYGLNDPYTQYLTQDEFSKRQSASEGKYKGTGIIFTWGLGNTELVVTEVIPGSAADEAGIKVGDKIIQLDDVVVREVNAEAVYKKMDHGDQETITYTLVDENQNKKEVQLAIKEVSRNLVKGQMVQSTIGYIDLAGLVDGTTDEIAKTIDELKGQGAKQLILDLRGVYSNNVKETAKLCDLFLEKQVAFSVQNKKGDLTSYETTEGSYDMPLVVLTNSYTEGVLEAFPAIVKESKRGLLVGTKTMGNGTVQEEVPLEDGSGLLITTGYVLDQKQEKIKEKGVEPDKIQSDTTSNALELVTTGTLKIENDAVVQKAIELLN